MNPQIDTLADPLADRETHEPGTRTSALLEEWYAARDEARETSHMLTMVAATKERGRQFRIPLLSAQLAALGEIVVDMHDKITEHAANCEHALAAALIESGPVDHGTDRYEGLDLGGMLRVYRTPLPFKPDHDGAHAATAIDDETA